MHASRITSKAQTTVPKAVRNALGLQAGDRIEYLIEGRTVRLQRAATLKDDPFATFDEWAGQTDTRAFANL
jgi:antitoxin PrlF